MINNKKEAEKIKFKIRDLLKIDKRSKEMYNKYNDLIPNDLIPLNFIL